MIHIANPIYDSVFKYLMGGLANGLSANKDNVSEGVQAVYDSTSTQKL